MILQQIILGLRDGSLFALVAIGLVILFKTTGLLNFAYGSMGMFAAYIVFTFVVFVSAPLWLAVIIGMAFAIALGLTAERFLLRPIRHLSRSALLIITLGMLMILEGLALQIWKQDYRQIPPLVTGRPMTIRFADVFLVIPQQDILIFWVTGFAVLGIFLYLKYTKMGLAIRATAQKEEAARLMGIRVNTVYAFSWGLAAALSALAAILAAPRTQIHPSMMIDLQIHGLIAAVLGGFESIPGAIVGGLLLGIIEQLVGSYISVELKLTFALVVVIVVLLIKPAGLLGKASRRRV